MDLLTSIYSLMLGGGSEWVTVGSLFAIAAFYFLLPVLGYLSQGRGALLRAMELLLVKLLLGLLRQGVILLVLYSGSDAPLSRFGLGPGGGFPGSGPGSRSGGQELALVLSGLGLIESFLFIVALFLFTRGLARTVRPRPEFPPHEPPGAAHVRPQRPS